MALSNSVLGPLGDSIVHYDSPIIGLVMFHRIVSSYSQPIVCVIIVSAFWNWKSEVITIHKNTYLQLHEWAGLGLYCKYIHMASWPILQHLDHETNSMRL